RQKVATMAVRRSVAQPGRALALGARRRRFESCRSDHFPFYAIGMCQVTMKTEALILSSGFQKLYCDAAVFTPFSTFIPISFQRALPFLAGDVVMDDPDLIEAEELHLAARS